MDVGHKLQQQWLLGHGPLGHRSHRRTQNFEKRILVRFESESGKVIKLSNPKGHSLDNKNFGLIACNQNLRGRKLNATGKLTTEFPPCVVSFLRNKTAVPSIYLRRSRLPVINGAWTGDQVRDYLQSETHPVRLSCHTTSGNLWMLSLWYLYEEGALWCATGGDAKILEYLREDPECAFEVSPNEPPYRGVRGRGPARIQPDENKRLLTRLIKRYLGDTDSTLARTLLDNDRDEYTIRLQPDQLFSWDYTQRMSDGT